MQTCEKCGMAFMTSSDTKLCSGCRYSDLESTQEIAQESTQIITQNNTSKYKPGTQKYKVYNHLKEGHSLTRLQAYELGFGLNLPARIEELKNDGVPIKAEYISHTNQQGKRGFIARYRLCHT